MAINISETIAAVAALGTASYGLVDATKAFNGGVSGAGFAYVRRTIAWLFPGDASIKDRQTPLALGAVLATLKANWLNGTAMADQKAIAKTLIKLRLNAGNAAFLAGKVGVNPAVLGTVATKMGTPGETLTPVETDVLGRFDLILTTALDEAYQRADQRYRNWCKLLAVPVSMALAVLGGWTIQPADYFHSALLGKALIVGLLATPLAPVAKDLSSAVQTGAKAVQAMMK